LYGGSADVFLQARKLRGAGDGNDPWLLRQQPGQRDLSRCRLLPLGDLAQQVDQRLIRLPVFRRKGNSASPRSSSFEYGP
jgi:hypothetical protein